MNRGHHVDALDYLRQAASTQHAAGYRYGEAIALECLGDVCALEQRAADAAEAWAQALAIFEELGDDARVHQVRERLAGFR